MQKILNSNFKKFFSTSAQPGRFTVCLFPGDGIGPEITESVVQIIETLKAPIDWEYHKIHTNSQTAEGDLISKESLDAVRHHKFALKGPFETPIGKGFRSLNVTLRKKLETYANVRPCVTIPGVKGLLYDEVNLVTIRENTEGEYSGLEHQVVPGIVENLKIISRTACQNITEYAFAYAQKEGRRKVSCCHKAGVMIKGDGEFVKVCREVAKKYPSIEYEEIQVDSLCQRLVKEPSYFDVMVMPNLYGDIVSDLASGLIGGLGLTASGNIGKNCAVYEAVHGTAPDIAGKNLCNPTALLLSSAMMLKDMGLVEYGLKIEKSVKKTIYEGKWITKDLGGKANKTEYTKALIDNLQNVNLSCN